MFDAAGSGATLELCATYEAYFGSGTKVIVLGKFGHIDVTLRCHLMQDVVEVLLVVPEGSVLKRNQRGRFVFGFWPSSP